jgi:hypothetical protein
MGVPQNGYTPKWIVYIGKSIYKRSPLSGATPFSQAQRAQPEDHLPGWIRLPRGLATAIPLFTTAKRVGNCFGFLASRIFLGGIVKP